jgi:hypothetical protein
MPAGRYRLTPSAVASRKAARIFPGSLPTMPRYTIAVTIQAPSIVERLQYELAQVGSPVPTTTLRALVASETGRALPAERLGRVLGYERQTFLKTRRPPRIALALTPDGRPASPQHLSDGDWRLVRRILTPDAVPAQAAALGVRLCSRAREDPVVREILAPHVQTAARSAFGSAADELLAVDPDWGDLYYRFLAAQPHGIGSYTAEQRDAERALEAQHISGLARYFGSEQPAVTVAPLTALRLPLAGERGEAFDDLVRRRAGDPSIARQVLAFIEEWGLLVDRLERAPTLTDYIEQWRVSPDDARSRLSMFRQVLPDESDPTALWRLLWEATALVGTGGIGAGLMRLISQPVIASSEPPTLGAYFLSSLYHQVSKPLGLQLNAAGIRPAVEPQDPPRDLRRLYKLANRATHNWARAALQEAGEREASVLGLDSLEPILDSEAAAVAEQALGSYRRLTAERKPREILLNVQKCLRVCADLTPLNPPPVITPLLAGASSAAAALAALASNGAVNVVSEVQDTMGTLYATA